ncbi:hypothetical protein DICVIV_02486 [Dictyocaulus viviparus]|uniref:Uncharacterized protein n=1 Tax=Dictyocaulus viviparus TaxID=29172 RepID=A0A0D8Y5A3_DICVI|nr:hypothetical protein DICVIV_02486 [Dictyocaulus viviparus]
MSENKDIGWMYEGAKSLVNREDYLLGKKIGKEFEKYSDVVNDQKPEALESLLHNRENKGIGWMYEGAKSLVNREDYLLGKKIGKEFEKYSDVVNDQKPEALESLLHNRFVCVNNKALFNLTEEVCHTAVVTCSTVVKPQPSAVKTKEKKKKRSQDSSEDHYCAQKSSKTSSNSQKETYNSSSGYEKSSRDSDAVKCERDSEEVTKRKHNCRSPASSRNKKKYPRSSSRSSSNSDSGHKTCSKDDIRRRRKSSSTEDKYRRRHSSYNKKETKKSLRVNVEDSSSSKDSSPVKRGSLRAFHKHSKRRSYEHEKRDTSASSSSSGREHSARKRRKLSDESTSSYKETKSKSSRKREVESNTSVHKSYTSPIHSSRHSRSLGKKTSHSPRNTKSSASPTTRPEPLDHSSENLADSRKNNQNNDTVPGNTDNIEKMGDDKSCLGEGNSSSGSVEEPGTLKLYDSHIPKHLRPEGLAVDYTEEEVEDEFDKMEKKRMERFMGYGLVGAKKQDGHSSAVENPYELSKRPVLPAYKKPKSRGPLTEEEKQKKLKEMEENAAWRKEIRKSNIKIASLIDDKEAAEDMTCKAPSFIRNQLSSAASDLTVEQRLQSKKKSLQRSHGFMEEKFTLK